MALLMQEIEQKINKPVRKWGPEEDALLNKMVEESCSFEEIQDKFAEFDPK